MFKKGKSMLPNKQARNYAEDLYSLVPLADAPPAKKLSEVKPLTLGQALPDSSSDEDNDDEVSFP